MAMATEVMQVLKSYSINCNAPGVESRDVEAFLPTIAKFIEKQEPVRMVLPAFPFKSPNSQDKVMGILPDLGEELALQHLNALCQNVAKVYEPGAEVHITSDGLVYNGMWLSSRHFRF
jgi:pyoverdine/dityrosine biosynthesis protein Dit1